MKIHQFKSNIKWLALLAVIMVGQNSFSQKRYPANIVKYPDGRIQLPDGRIKYPDGTVVWPDGRVKSPNSTVITPANQVQRYPDGRVINPNDRVRNRTNRNYNNQGNYRRNNLPPGQAKKQYGEGNARDYAPGHKKNRGNHEDGDKHGNEGNHGKGNKHDD